MINHINADSLLHPVTAQAVRDSIALVNKYKIDFLFIGIFSLILFIILVFGVCAVVLTKD